MSVQDKEISAVATSIFNSIKSIDVGRVSYLRMLIDATQDVIGKKAEPAATQLAALQSVHERFYEIILTAAQPFVPRTQKDRAVELHRRANFARTALSAVRGHIRAGEDIYQVNAQKVTKAALAKPKAKPPKVSVKRWKERAETQSKALIATLMGLSDADKAAAITEMQLVLGQLTHQLVAMGVNVTKDADLAAVEHRPFKHGKVLFMPTDTQVTRQIARPS